MASSIPSAGYPDYRPSRPPASQAGSDHRGVYSPTRLHIASSAPVEIWFQDEARLGQKNGLTRLWARKGEPADSAITTPICRRHLSGSRQGGGAHCLGRTRKRRCISTRSPPRRPKGPCGCAGPDAANSKSRRTSPSSCCQRAPELNPVENIWQYLRANWPRVRRLQCHRRCWMRSLEKAHRTARNHHINRNAKMGPYRSLNAAGIRAMIFVVIPPRERPMAWL